MCAGQAVWNACRAAMILAPEVTCCSERVTYRYCKHNLYLTTMKLREGSQHFLPNLLVLGLCK